MIPQFTRVFNERLKIWEKILTPAENGPVPAPNSSAKTLAKNALRHYCPIRKYVSYKLAKGGSWMLHAGGTAALEATEKGFVVTDETFALMTKAA